VSGEETTSTARLIRRYSNRKLYDPRARCYVTLEDLARLVADGEDIRVVDQDSGDDLTSLVLAQVVLEGIKQRTADVPRQVLLRLVRLGFRSQARSARSAVVDVATRSRAEAERLVGGLLARGRLSLEEALSLRQEITHSLQGLVGDAQRGLEDRIHGLLERTESEGGVSPSLQALRERLLALETYLEVPAPAPPARKRRRPRRGGATRT